MPVAIQQAFQNATMADGPSDPTAWIAEGSIADFLLMKTAGIRWLCMFIYTFYHGYKLFGSLKEEQPLPYKFVRMVFQCTGGGLLVPLFINAIPVSLGNDAYPICIFASMILHNYFPVLREIVGLAPMLKAALIVMYETQRASVVVKLTTAAAAAIPATEFAIPLFGPIFCGSIAGCGGAFLPLDKGLTPIESGLAQNMISAFFAATGYHLFVNTSLSDGIPDAAKKAQVVIAYYFIFYTIAAEVGFANIFTTNTSKVEKAVEKAVEPAEPAPTAEKTTSKKKTKKDD